MDNRILRIIDANYNRAKEAFRVNEDILRFFYENKSLTAKFKLFRHKLTDILKDKPFSLEMIQQRDSESDPGKAIDNLEIKRKDIPDTFYANSQRIKESLRVLEEMLKLIDKKIVGKIKKMRYNFYSLEKDAGKKVQNISANR